MAAHLELFHRQMCARSAAVRRYVETHKLKPQIKHHDIDETNHARQNLKNIAGDEQVPVLSVDGEPVKGSEAIIAWLQENLVSKKVV